MSDASKVGREGGLARAAKLTPERRKEIAQRAGRARWAPRSRPTNVDEDTWTVSLEIPTFVVRFVVWK